MRDSKIKNYWDSYSLLALFLSVYLYTLYTYVQLIQYNKTLLASSKEKKLLLSI